jgi:hypothetical protein
MRISGGEQFRAHAMALHDRKPLDSGFPSDAAADYTHESAATIKPFDRHRWDEVLILNSDAETESIGHVNLQAVAEPGCNQFNTSSTMG